MDLFPAIDLRGGRCVRLLRGDYDAETVYGDDPVAVARSFAAAGAAWIHVVDLDAARTGEATNLDHVAAVAAAVDVPVQSGGGVRTLAAARRLADAGVARVVIGTAAVEDPALVAAAAQVVPVAVGLDGRAGEVAVHGWTRTTGRRVLDVAASLAEAGASAFVLTEITRDGTLEGPDVGGLTAAVEALDAEIVASGGVGSLADLEALAAIDAGGSGLAGVIVGTALYEGRFTVAEAVAALAGRRSEPAS